MSRPHFQISVDEIGRGTIALNGEDITDGVRGLTLTTGVDDVTRLSIDFIAVSVDVGATGDLVINTVEQP